VADRTLVGPTRSGRSQRVVVVVFVGGGGSGGGFTVAGFVSTESLVRRERFVAYTALV